MDKDKLKTFLFWLVVGACLTLGIVLASLFYVKTMSNHRAPPISQSRVLSDKQCTRNICEMPVRRIVRQRDLEI